MLVDSHCHLDRLDLAAHDGSLDAALDAARQRGVGHFLCIGVSVENAADVKALAERYADVDCSVGVHPLDVQPGAAPALDWLLRELDHPRVVAIGETGLDYHYEPEAAELQQASFRLHLQAAQQTGKPVIVHTRGARADTLALLREAALPQAGVLHCFTEDWDMAKAALHGHAPHQPQARRQRRIGYQGPGRLCDFQRDGQPTPGRRGHCRNWRAG